LVELKTIPDIKVTPPGPNAKKLLELDDKYISPSYARFYPLVVDSAKDCLLKDVDGNTYLDFNAGISVVNVGHSHPKVVKAIQNQATKLIHYSNTDFYYEESLLLAEKLCNVTPGNFPKRVFFTNSGAEAVEASFKVARWHTRRPQIVAFTKGFHGRTMGALSLTGSKVVQRRWFFPLVPGVTHVPFGYCYRCAFKEEYPGCDFQCINYIDEVVFETFLPPEETLGFLFEPIQGEGGIVVPPDGYFQRLRKLAAKHNMLLIDDEVQTGLGRTGKLFAIEHWGIEPDVIAIAKGIAAGLPLGACVAKANIMDWDPGAHASTFAGNPVSCVAALATLNILADENLVDNAARLGESCIKRLKEMQEKYELIGDVRGKGLFIGIELVKDRKNKKPAKEEAHEIIFQCFKKGLAIITAGYSTIRIAPPLVITEELMDIGLEIFEEVLRNVNAG